MSGVAHLKGCKWRLRCRDLYANSAGAVAQRKGGQSAAATAAKCMKYHRERGRSKGNLGSRVQLTRQQCKPIIEDNRISYPF